MKPILSFSRLCIVMLVCAAVAACGKTGPALGEMAPVSGKVTVDGQPVTSGQISLIPFDKETATGGSACAGQIDSNGGFVIYTAGKEGAPIGRYKVTITPSMVPSGDGKMPVSPFNQKFSDQSKTPLTINVQANAPAGSYDQKLTK